MVLQLRGEHALQADEESERALVGGQGCGSCTWFCAEAWCRVLHLQVSCVTGQAAGMADPTSAPARS